MRLVGAGMHVGVAWPRPDLTISVHSWNRRHVSVHSWNQKPVSVHSWVSVHLWKFSVHLWVSVHSWKFSVHSWKFSVHSWKPKPVSVHSWHWKYISVHSWRQKHVSWSVAASIVVSLGYGSRLLTERAEVVGGLTAAAGAQPYCRPRVRDMRLRICIS